MYIFLNVSVIFEVILNSLRSLAFELRYQENILSLRIKCVRACVCVCVSTSVCVTCV